MEGIRKRRRERERWGEVYEETPWNKRENIVSLSFSHSLTPFCIPQRRKSILIETIHHSLGPRCFQLLSRLSSLSSSLSCTFFLSLSFFNISYTLCEFFFNFFSILLLFSGILLRYSSSAKNFGDLCGTACCQRRGLNGYTPFFCLVKFPCLAVATLQTERVSVFWKLRK